MNTTPDIEQSLRRLDKTLVQELLLVCEVVEAPAGTELLREGQYVRVVPLVISGMVRVFTRQGEKELLLYYIQPEESCVMSFTAGLNQEKSKIFAVAEEPTVLMLIPSSQIPALLGKHPSLNKLFYQQFDQRYTDLITTINHLMFDPLEKRLYDHLTGYVERTHNNPVKISHRDIANNLGTAREVITRLVKKLENQGKLKQHRDSIEVF
ncbi:MAG: Crp/Fnr family transcriptional regulator [Dinghuibacter sp.]|nr:Crp/Fnr family transcriptional regulator [Dinghuibacter sp.]